MENKFAEQLSLRLGELKGTLTHKEIAQSVPVSNAQLTRLANGERKGDKATRVSLAKKLASYWVSLSGAREDYHVLSFMKDSKRHDDVMSALFQQRKEENDRRKLEEDFDVAMGMKKEARSPQQTLLIDDYFREYAEEIAAEQTDFAKKAAYVGVNVQDVVAAGNKRYGG